MRIRRSHRLLFTTIFTFVFTLGASSAFAQDEPVAKNTSDTPIEGSAAPLGTAVTETTTPAAATNALTRVGIQSGQPVSLSLDEAIRRALANNNSIELTRDDVRFQETRIRSILGFYDPVFTVSPTLTRNSTTGSGSATHDFNVNSSVTHFLRAGGGNYQAFFNNTRTENAFSQQQVSSGNISGGGSAVFLSQLGFRFTQPLFRNFRIDANRRTLKIARRQLEQSDADFRRQTIEIIAQVQRTYWDLVFALRDQQNRQANLELSRENLRQVEARIKAGAAAPLSRWEVETELANRESELLIATQLVATTENALKQLLLKDATSPEWTASYVPTDRPAFNVDTISLDGAIKDAMDNRYELRRLKLAADINKIDLAYFKDQTRPRIDLNTTFSLDGLSLGGASTESVTVPLISGNPNTNANAFLLQTIRNLHPKSTINVPTVTFPGTPSFLSGGFNRSLGNMFRSDSPNYSVGVTFSFPFRNRTAKADLAGARITENRLATEMRAQEQLVIVEVRNAVQAVETARQRVLSARRARENAEELLKGERALFDAGRSTTFLLFQRENALTNARNSEIRAETDYNKAIADLQKATSTTFQRNNIEVDSPTDDN